MGRDLRLGIILLFCMNTAITRADADPSEQRMYAVSVTHKIEKPAFLKATIDSFGVSRLFVSSFSLFGDGKVFSYADAGQLVFPHNETPAHKTEVLSGLQWPNEVTKLDFPQTLGSGFYGLGDGFLVPGKRTGGVYVFHPDSGEQLQISSPKSRWFYHKVMAFDWDGDGDHDVVSARAQTSILGSARGELVVFENDGTSKSGSWRELFVLPGPDALFDLVDLDGDGRVEIVATEFFSRRFVVYSRRPGAEEFSVVYQDETIGRAFDLDFADVNRDGKREFIVTNHEGDEKAGVFAYLPPRDLMSGGWERKTLYEGYVTRQPGINSASPGKAQSFYPVKSWEEKGHKPWILVSGDGTQMAHILRPVSSDPEDWNYDHFDVYFAGATVGLSAVGDLDGDGEAEVIVPAYDKDTIAVLTLQEVPAN